jgi:DNA primase
LSKDYLEDIRNAVSIKDVVSEVVKLSKKGREYTGLCPFHGEKSPSFFVNNTKGFYYCFGCQARGNIFNFYMEYYKMSFQEALEALAKKGNISIPKNVSFNSVNQTKVNRLYEACNIATNYFCDKLNSKEGQSAREYLEKRQVSQGVIRDFEIGYAPYNSTELWKELEKAGVYEEDILEIGLKNYNQHGEVYDFFRNRLIFPIKNKLGKVIAFGGRALGDEMPKYLNTKESEVFHKKMNLYGLYDSLKNLKNNHLIVVEGYMDVVSMHQFGYKTAVAGLGTAITMEHLKTLHMYDKSPIFCMDGDSAGLKATARIVENYLPILEPGMTPSFVIMKDAKDPDAFLKENKKEDFDELILNGKGISEFLWEQETNGKKLNLPEVSSACLKNLTVMVSEIKDGLLRSKFVEYFRNNIYKYSRSFNNTGVAVANQWRYQKDSFLINVKKEQAYILLACILKSPAILVDVEEKLGECTFENEDLENLRLFLIDNLDTITQNEQVDDLLSKNGLLILTKDIFSSNLVKPLHLLNSFDAKNIFDTTYMLMYKNFLENERLLVMNKLKKLMEELHLVKNSGENKDKEKEIFYKIEVLNLQQKEITNQILKIK